GEDESAGGFGKVRLHSQGLLSVATRFLPPRRYRVEAMIRPALRHGEASKSRGKVWIELERLLKKRLRLQRCVVKHVHSIGVIVCLNEEEIGVRILGWSPIETRFFIWRKLCLKSRGNFLREIGLNGEDVGQIAIVIFRPNVLVVVSLNKLHIYSYDVST